MTSFHSVFRPALTLAALLLVAGCAAPEPVLYPNDHLAYVGRDAAEEDIDDCQHMAETAGAKVISQVGQHLDKPTSHYIGPGKLEEVKSLLENKDCSVAIFDDELTPNQQKNLEGALQVKVIDRTALILDIFSRHAKTREGQMQVELAQHAAQPKHKECSNGGKNDNVEELEAVTH